MSKQQSAIEISKQSGSLVSQIAETEDIVKQVKAFQELCTKLLDDSDYQEIGKNRYKKKSAWRKLGLAFGVSTTVIDKHRETLDDGSFIWEFVVRATAPNGRWTEAAGSCYSGERKFAHLQHDVFATAQTRATNRAVSDLIGAGEVSAEEVEADEQFQRSAPKESRNVTPPKADVLKAEESSKLVTELKKIVWLHKMDEGGERKMNESDLVGYARIFKNGTEACPLLHEMIQGHKGAFFLDGFLYTEEEEAGLYHKVKKEAL